MGILGNEKDRVNSPRKSEKFFEELDKAFFSDLNFSISSLVNVLQVLSLWPGYLNEAKENTWYIATEEQISEICLKNIKGIKKSEIPLILNFLTLKSEDVIKLVGVQRIEPDLPVWEYRKRFSRYNIRPLIQLKGKYLWGPYSARKAGIIWAGTPSSGRLPYDMGSPFIQSVVKEEKKLVETALVDKTEDIVKRFTQFVEKNLFFHKRDKNGNHPGDLGDYDVLAYYPQKNVVINIENKDLLPPFCLKDTRRLRESIFGSSSLAKGYLGKVESREKYLQDNILQIGMFLNWNLDAANPPKVISLFVSRMVYWWTHFPPRITTVKFLRIDFLHDFIKSL